jgi:hypothetical protein
MVCDAFSSRTYAIFLFSYLVQRCHLKKLGYTSKYIEYELLAAGFWNTFIC